MRWRRPSFERVGLFLRVYGGDLTDELGPIHIHGFINGAGFWHEIVFENLHHQRAVVRNHYAGLDHSQNPGLVLGLAESSTSVHWDVRVEPLADGGHGRESCAHFQRENGEDELLSARRL